MNLAALCIRRPVFTVMLMMLPIVFGTISLKRMGVGLFPNVDLPIVVVTTSRPGASADEMETGVTKLIEEQVNSVAEIDELRSETREGLSLVTIIFLLSKNPDVGFQEVQSKVNTLLSRLPSGTETPIVDKFDVGAAPVMTVVVSGRRDLRDLTEIADKRIAESLGGLRGVGSVTLVGGRHRAIQVAIDPQRLEGYGLSIDQVREALRAQNLEIPGGRVERRERELVLRTLGRVAEPEQIADIIVANLGGQPVRIRDVGGAQAVEDSSEEPRSLARFDGRSAVTLVVQKQSGANSVEVIDTVKQSLVRLQATLVGEGMADLELEVVRDQSVFIKESLHEVETHLLLGAVLVVLTILLFLRDWRATLIAAVAIPTSLLAAFPVMGAFHLTLDNITLIGLVLVIGIVIDDAVIVIENVYRWIHVHGRSPLEAALEGTKEITLAVVATTLSLAVIFIPIAFMSGTVGLFLRAFGITCAVCILSSLLVSLTLTPMLASRWMKRARAGAAGHGDAEDSGRFYRWLIEKPYLAILRASMRHRWTVVLLTLVAFFSVFPIPSLHFPGLIGMVGIDFVPKDDSNEFVVAVTAPPGWSLEKTGATFAAIRKRIAAWPEVTHVLEQIGDTSGRRAKGEGSVTTGSFFVKLVPLVERDPPFSQFDVMARTRVLLKDYADLRTSVQIPRAIEGGGFSNSDVEFLLLGPDLDRLREYAGRMIAKLRTLPGLADIDTTLAERSPEFRIAIDRERASDLGLSVEKVAASLKTLIGGQIVSDYKDASIGEQYDVWLRADESQRADVEAIAALTLENDRGELVQLQSVATPAEALGPAQIDRAFRQRKISIVANLAGMPTATAAKSFQDAFAELGAPPAYSLVTTGSAKNAAESNKAFVFALGMSLLLMYMILAAQFESFIHPITILLAVPLTIPFALISQIFFGRSLTLFSMLGLFLLFGIVKKNGILQVDYTNTLRARAEADPSILPAPYSGAAQGGGFAGWVARLAPDKRLRLWAIIEANRVRLRPILMTTLILVAAMVPIALGKGPGAANRADMARIIIGGQALSLLLSLLVTPVAYSLFADLAAVFRRRGRAAEPA